MQIASPDILSRYRGCLLAGAAGDALGAPVEFTALPEILAWYGDRGVRDFLPAAGSGLSYPPGAPPWCARGGITDDTQMTLYTAHALLPFLHTDPIATLRSSAPGSGSNMERECKAGSVGTDAGLGSWFSAPPQIADTTLQGFDLAAAQALRQAYTEWYLGQTGRPLPAGYTFSLLAQIPGLAASRGPGNTCLSALSESIRTGKILAANNSKGCGGIMRAAPAGLFAASLHALNHTAGEGHLLSGMAHPAGNKSSRHTLEAGAQRRGVAFRLGALSAAITHGHSSGQLSAGFHAALIAELVSAVPLPTAIQNVLRLLETVPGHEETEAAVLAALEFATVQPDPKKAIPRLGEGWVGEEALAIALYCALWSLRERRGLEEAVVAAVTITGDSDSTGSITGTIVGAMYGEEAIPARWLEDLELRPLIVSMAEDLCPRSRSWSTRQEGTVAPRESQE